MILDFYRPTPIRMITRLKEPFELSFWAHVEKAEAGCWLWRGTLDLTGYGTIEIARNKVRLAHRIAYQLFYGERPIQVLHSCGNLQCVNPAHLYQGEKNV